MLCICLTLNRTKHNFLLLLHCSYVIVSYQTELNITVFFPLNLLWLATGDHQSIHCCLHFLLMSFSCFSSSLLTCTSFTGYATASHYTELNITVIYSTELITTCHSGYLVYIIMPSSSNSLSLFSFSALHTHFFYSYSCWQSPQITIVLLLHCCTVKSSSSAHLILSNLLMQDLACSSQSFILLPAKLWNSLPTSTVFPTPSDLTLRGRF